MTIISLYYFDQLKRNTAERAGIVNMYASDCKALSVSIFKKTHKDISETTLKRIYGFAQSSFKPSIFTLDTMSQYCDCINWADFCEKQEQHRQNKSDNNIISWDSLKKNAQKATQYTLKSLKNRSGIPYNKTIYRNYIDDHFEFFLQGYYTGTIFMAPAGYGKTIALCHWVEKRIESNIATNNNEIILFFSSHALMNSYVNGKNLNDWLLSLLGMNPGDDVEALLSENSKLANRFFLIIDGFDAHLFSSIQYESLFKEILDIVALYKQLPWLKVILTMRSASYATCRHLIGDNNKDWFSGFLSANDGTTANVPLLNGKELQTLCYNINPTKTHTISVDIVKKFGYPLFLQFYYQDHVNNFSLTHIDDITINELVATFIYNNIYRGHHSEEKVLLTSGLLNTLDYKTQTFNINKLEVHELIRKYRHAYKQLLSLGYIKELNTSAELNYNVNIQFGNNSFFEYNIAKKLLLITHYSLLKWIIC